MRYFVNSKNGLRELPDNISVEAEDTDGNVFGIINDHKINLTDYTEISKDDFEEVKLLNVPLTTVQQQIEALERSISPRNWLEARRGDEFANSKIDDITRQIDGLRLLL